MYIIMFYFQVAAQSLREGKCETMKNLNPTTQLKLKGDDRFDIVSNARLRWLFSIAVEWTKSAKTWTHCSE